MSTIIITLLWTDFTMARRDLLTDAERRALFGVPETREDLARHYMLSPRDLVSVVAKRGDTNRLGFAVQFALLRHPGFGFTLEEGAPEGTMRKCGHSRCGSLLGGGVAVIVVGQARIPSLEQGP